MPTQGVTRLELALESSPISAVRQAVDRLARENGLTDEARFELQLAVSEAVANALRHGSGETAHVDVFLAARNGMIEIEVKDHGFFEPRSSVDAERGRGLPRMVALLDEVEVAAGQDGTRVRLRKRLAA